jgi:hypothetical protein
VWLRVLSELAVRIRRLFQHDRQVPLEKREMKLRCPSGMLITAT